MSTKKEAPVESLADHQPVSTREIVRDIWRRGALLWVCGSLFLQVTEIVARLVGAKILGPDSQGILEIVVAWSATGMLLVSGGFSTAAHIHVADTKNPDERQSIFTVGVLGVFASWAILALVGVIVLLTTSRIPGMIGERAVLILAIILIGGFAEPRFGLLGLLGTGLKRYALVGHNRFLMGTLFLAGWTLGAWLFGVSGVLIGWLIALLTGAVFLAPRLQLPFSFRITAPQRARQVCRHAWHCLGNQVTSRITEYLCIFLLAAYSISKKDIGNYGVAITLARILVLIPAMLGSLSLPYMVSIQRNPVRHLRLSRLLFWAVLVLTVGFWFCLSWITGRFVPAFLPRFDEAGHLFQILAIAYVAAALCQPLGTRFLSLHLPSWNFAVNLSSLLILVLFAFLWIPGMGIWGLAYAWCARSLFQLVVLLVLTRQSFLLEQIRVGRPRS